MMARRYFAFTVLLSLLCGIAFADTHFSTVRDAATEVEFVGNQGIGEGAVAESFDAFWFELQRETRLSLEVYVTEEREGVRFSDDDSMLFLFDSRGKLLSSNDDGGPGATSRIDEIMLPGGDRYYAVVTTFPNEPETSESGVFQTLADLGSSNIAFELHLRKLEEGDSGKRLMGALKSGDRGMAVLQNARPIDLQGGRGIAEGIVRTDQEVFSLDIRERSTVNLEVVVTEVYQGEEYRDDDSMLFLFDDRGVLLAEDDDGGERSASALQTALDTPGRYYAVVTTYDNEPELDEDNRLVRFPGTGKSSIRFALRVTVR